MRERRNSEQFKRLRAEAKAPYRILRKFIYVTFAVSGGLGALIFFLQLLAGKGEFESTLSNLGIQVGVIVAMIFLFRLEKK